MWSMAVSIVCGRILLLLAMPADRHRRRNGGNPDWTILLAQVRWFARGTPRVACLALPRHYSLPDGAMVSADACSSGRLEFSQGCARPVARCCSSRATAADLGRKRGLCPAKRRSFPDAETHGFSARRRRRAQKARPRGCPACQIASRQTESCDISATGFLQANAPDLRHLAASGAFPVSHEASG